MSREYFSVLGTRPQIGRLIAPEDVPTVRGAREIVISDLVWRRMFGGESRALGQRLLVNGSYYVVVGVAQAGFQGLEMTPPAGWVAITDAGDFGIPRDAQESRFLTWLSVVVRSATDTLALQRMLDARIRSDVDRNAAWGARGLEPPTVKASGLKQNVGGGSLAPDRLAVSLAGLSIVLLVIGCLNAAVLTTGQGLADARERAIRIALGAVPRKMAIESAVEGLAFATVSLVVGIVAAFATLIVSQTFLSIGFQSVLGGRRAYIALGAGILTCTIAAGLPGLASARAVDLSTLTKDRDSSRPLIVLRTLQLIETAMSVVLVTSTLAVLENIHRVSTADLGYARDQLLMLKVDPGNNELSYALYREIKERLVAASEVVGSAIATAIPLEGTPTYFVAPPGSPEFGEVQPLSMPGHAVDTGYFRTLGMRMLMGRGFGGQDRAESPLVAVVNQAFANMYWPKVSAVGGCISAGSFRCGRRVVGVVADAAFGHVTEQQRPMMFVPLAQDPARGHALQSLAIRTRGPAINQLIPIRSIVASSSASGSFTIIPLNSLVQSQIATWRTGATALACFGALGLLLAIVAVYSTARFYVLTRRHELALRTALGARPVQLGSLVIRVQSPAMLSGLAIGLALSWPALAILSGALHLALHRVTVAATAGAVIFLSTLIGLAVPALQAGTVDPAAALRSG